MDLVGWGGDANFTIANGPAAGQTVDPGNGNFAGTGNGGWFVAPDGNWDGTTAAPDDGTPDDLIPFVLPCFVAGTRIATPDGDRRVETLAAGDRVTTHRGGTAPVTWVGRVRVFLPANGGASRPRPVRINAHAFGEGQPRHDLAVSPQHRVLVGGPALELLVGTPEALVAARHLIDGRRVVWDAGATSATCVHVMCDRHVVLMSEGLPTESFHPGDVTLAGLAAETRAELLALFPQLRGTRRPHTALPVLQSWEARALLGHRRAGPAAGPGP